MGVNSLPKTVTRQRRGCDLNPGPSAPEYSTLTTRLSSHPLAVEDCDLLRKEDLFRATPPAGRSCCLSAAIFLHPVTVYSRSSPSGSHALP